MKRKFWGIKPTAGVLFAFASSTFLTNYVQAQQTVAAKTETVAQQQLKITDAKKINATTVEITFSNQQKLYWISMETISSDYSRTIAEKGCVIRSQTRG